MSDDLDLIERMASIASEINSGHYGQTLLGGFTAKVVNEQSLKVTKGDFKTSFPVGFINDLTNNEVIIILNYRYNTFCKLKNKAKYYKSALLAVNSAISEASASNLSEFKLSACKNTFDVLVHTGHIKPAKDDGWLHGTYQGYEVTKNTNTSCSDGAWDVEVLC